MAGLNAEKVKMIDRRKFCKSGVFVLAGGLIVANRPPSAVTGNANGALKTTVIYDRRIAASCTFARGACGIGVSLIELRADVGELWHNTVGPRLQGAAHQLMGLTLGSDFFLLQRLTADARMKIGHETTCPGGLVLWIITDAEHPATYPLNSTPV